MFRRLPTLERATSYFSHPPAKEEDRESNGGKDSNLNCFHGLMGCATRTLYLMNYETSEGRILVFLVSCFAFSTF